NIAELNSNKSSINWIEVQIFCCSRCKDLSCLIDNWLSLELCSSNLNIKCSTCCFNPYSANELHSVVVSFKFSRNSVLSSYRNPLSFQIDCPCAARKGSRVLLFDYLSIQWPSAKHLLKVRGE